MTKRAKKITCNWLMMRSSHCPNLVRIGCNTDFLSRFQSSIFRGVDREELRETSLC